MTGPAPAAALVLAALSLVAPGPRRSAGLRKLSLPMAGRSFRSSAVGRRLLAAAAGLCCLVSVGGRAGLVLGVIVCIVIDRVLARRPDPSVARERAVARRDLPIALDLLGCVLRAGQPPSSAAAAVAAAVGGPVGVALNAVARACALGASADRAWEPLGRLAGGAATARSMARAARSGSALAEELGRTAEALRDAGSAAAEGRVHRVGVLVVLPLGLCFLPAFICVGVLPVIIGVAGSVLR